jgi:hypothetical protein
MVEPRAFCSTWSMPVTCLRARLAVALLVGGATLAAAPCAFADDDDERPKKRRRMIVTVEDNDEVDGEDEEEEAKTKSNAPDAPDPGDPPEEIRAYLDYLKERTRSLKNRMKVARRTGNEDEEAELSGELAKAQVQYESERERLTERNTGMIAGGATLIGLGSASFLASIVLVCGWGLSGIDGNPDDEFGWGALGTLVGGFVGIGAGTPLLVIGLQRNPRSGPDSGALPPPPVGFTPGLTVSIPF